jgi:hypothetical protein
LFSLNVGDGDIFMRTSREIPTNAIEPTNSKRSSFLRSRLIRSSREVPRTGWYAKVSVIIACALTIVYQMVSLVNAKGLPYVSSNVVEISYDPSSQLCTVTRDFTRREIYQKATTKEMPSAASKNDCYKRVTKNGSEIFTSDAYNFN